MTFFYYFYSYSQGVAVAAESDSVRLIDFLVNVTCNGQPAFSLYSCVNNGTLCSGKGTCINGTCSCHNNRGGKYCEIQGTDVSSDTMSIALGNIFLLRTEQVQILWCSQRK